MTDNQLFEESLLLKDKGRYAEAQIRLEQLVARELKSAALYAVLGDVYWEQSLLDDAVQAFRIATSLAPKSETASLGLFHCLWENGNRGAAITEAWRFSKVADSNDYMDILKELEGSEEYKHIVQRLYFPPKSNI